MLLVQTYILYNTTCTIVCGNSCLYSWWWARCTPETCKLAVNKYLHTVVSCWILSIQSHDARKHEYKIQYHIYNSVELYIHLSCLPPWHILGQLYFTFTSYLCTSPKRSHISGLVGRYLYITYLLHAHFLTLYLICIVPIRLTLWRVTITNLIIQGVTGETDQTSGGCSLC